MIVTYHNTIEDMVAFNRYHCVNSPAIKKARLPFLALMWALLIAGAFFSPQEKETTRPMIVAAAVLFAGLFSLVYIRSYPGIVERNARRLYKEGKNKGFLCSHELEVDASGLVERTEVNETRQSWQGVERIVETDEHVFIYVSSLMGHVIPKRSVVSGDVDGFIEKAKQFWSAANPETDV